MNADRAFPDDAARFRSGNPLAVTGTNCTKTDITPTCDTALLLAGALAGLRSIYRPGYNIAKAGVMLLDLVDQTHEQTELDLDAPPQDKGRLMATVDGLNRRYGRGTVTPGSAAPGSARRRWMMRQELKTPNYTTCWDELPIVRA